MSRTQTLEVPQHVAGTDLRPVVALLPVAAVDGSGTELQRDRGSGGNVARAVKGAVALALVGHLATAGMALRDAVSRPAIAWETAGIAKTATLARIAVLPVLGPTGYTKDVKPKLELATKAMALQGG